MNRLGTLAGSIALFLVVLGIGWGIYRYKASMIAAQMSAPPPPEMPEAISLIHAKPQNYRQNITSIGTVVAPRWITLRNEIAGRIVSMSLADGAIVEQGQILLELDHSVEDAQLKSAQARQRIAKSIFDRTRRAADANASSGAELDQADGEFAQAAAEVERLQALIAKKTLRAPFRARVGLLDMHLGQYLMEGVEITTLQGIDSYVHVDFMMPEAVADVVTVGQPVKLIHGAATLDGSVVALSARADRATRNLMGRARVEQPPPELQPNDSVKVAIEYGPAQEVLTIPAAALRRDPSGSFVFVAEPDQEGKWRVQQQTVRTGGTIGNAVVILQGITADHWIAADGSFKLHAGALVANPQGADQKKVSAKPVATETAATAEEKSR